MSQQAPSASQQRTTTNPGRQVAHRAFASELNDARYTFRESDAERAPVYALLPTGAAANRFFHVGALVEAEDIGSESEYWRGRIVDPTGTVFVYAGQYQQAAASVLRGIEPPAYVAVVGKPRTYETDDDDVLVSIRPESITVVDAATRDRWVTETAQLTVARLDSFDDADNGYGAIVHAHYEPDFDGYRGSVIEALESIDEERSSAEASDPAEAVSADEADEDSDS